MFLHGHVGLWWSLLPPASGNSLLFGARLGFLEFIRQDTGARAIVVCLKQPSASKPAPGAGKPELSVLILKPQL